MSDRRGWFLGLVRGGIEDAFKGAIKWALGGLAVLVLGFFGYGLVRKEDGPPAQPAPARLTAVGAGPSQPAAPTDRPRPPTGGGVGPAGGVGVSPSPAATAAPASGPAPGAAIVQAPRPKLATIALVVSPGAPFTATMTTPVHDPYNGRAFDTTVTLHSGPGGAKLKLLLNSRGEADGWTASAVGADSGCFGAPGRVDHDLPMSQPGKWRSDGKGFLSLPPNLEFPASVSFFCYSGIKAGDDVTLRMRIYALNGQGDIDPFDVFLPTPVRVVGDD